VKISLDSLVPYEKLETDTQHVLQVVESKGHAILLKDNQPIYIIIKYSEDIDLPDKTTGIRRSEYTLQEAMRIVLAEKEDNKLHAAALADEVFSRGLYYKKNGDKAQYNQIRARANHYPNLFEALPGNIIKLKERNQV
jgi:antitoxin Phd